MKHFSTPLALCVLGLATGLGSCRAVGNLTGNPDAKARSSINWVTLPTFDPVNAAETTIYFRVRNPAGAAEFSFIEQELRQAATNRGYQVTTNPDEADYYYEVLFRFFDENPNRDNGDSVLAAAGGVAAGVGAWEALDGVNSGAVRGGGAVVVGALAAGAISNMTAAVEWNLLMDVAIGQRIDGGVETNLSSGNSGDNRTSLGSDSIGIGQGAGQNTGYQNVAGNENRQNSRNQSTSVTSEFFRHEARMLGVARQMRMSREEAFAALRDKVMISIPELLP